MNIEEHDLVKLLLKFRKVNYSLSYVNMEDISNAYCFAYNINNVINGIHGYNYNNLWTDTCWVKPKKNESIGDMTYLAYSSAINNNVSIYCIVPVKETKYWFDYCKYADITYLPEKMFISYEYNCYSPYAKAAVLTFRPDMHIRKQKITYLKW